MKNKIAIILGCILLSISSAQNVLAKKNTENTSIFTEYLSKEGQREEEFTEEYQYCENGREKECKELGTDWNVRYLFTNNKAELPCFYKESLSEIEIKTLIDKLRRIYGEEESSKDSFKYQWIGIEDHTYNMELEIVQKDISSSARLLFSKCCKKVEILVDGEKYGTYFLNDEQMIKIGSTNVCEIKNYMCKMVNANCPKQLCISQKAIDESGGSIICLPNKIVINGVEEENAMTAIDSVV